MPVVPAAVLACAAMLCACRLGFDQLGDDIIDDASIGSDARPDGGGGNPDAADAAMVACPASYTVLPGVPTASRYRIIDNSDDWAVGESACEADGHHLAVPDSIIELSALTTALPGVNIWVGVTDLITEGTYLRVTGGVATYLPWEPGEPDVEDCVYLDGFSLQYRAQDCGSGRRAICECDGAPADPSTF